MLLLLSFLEACCHCCLFRGEPLLDLINETVDDRCIHSIIVQWPLMMMVESSPPADELLFSRVMERVTCFLLFPNKTSENEMIFIGETRYSIYIPQLQRSFPTRCKKKDGKVKGL